MNFVDMETSSPPNFMGLGGTLSLTIKNRSGSSDFHCHLHALGATFMNDQKKLDKLEQFVEGGLGEFIHHRRMARRLKGIIPDLKDRLKQARLSLAEEIADSNTYRYLTEDVPTFQSLFGGLHETRYTKLLAWLLSREREGNLGSHVLHALLPDEVLQRIYDDEDVDTTSNHTVTTEESISSGSVDLKISDGETFILFVEVKTGSDESREKQLADYAADLKNEEFDQRFLLCLCRKDTKLSSESDVKRDSEIQYQRVHWNSFLGELFDVLQKQEQQIAEETRLIIRMLIRDQILAMADVDEKQLNQLENMTGKDQDPDELPGLEQLQNLKQSIQELEGKDELAKR